MKLISPNQWPEIISGANLLATGGGGTIGDALSIVKRIKQAVKLVSLNELKPDDLICTVFGVGGKQNCDPVVASQTAFSIFQKILRQRIAVIIPVEVGPMAFANTAFIANKLKIPLLDSDIVGMRSSPEVFLETITIPGIKRTPCIIADDKGKYLIIRRRRNLKALEKTLRNFAVSAGGDAFVAGYPLKVKSIKGIIPEDSITLSRETGNLLQKLRCGKINLKQFCELSSWKLTNEGVIIKVENNNSAGFSEGKYTIRSVKDNLTIIFKNENLVFLKNGKVALTCPDSITLLDLDSFEAINNFEENDGKRVAILGKKAIPIWRTLKGRKLFSPKNLGLDYKQRLLM